MVQSNNQSLMIMVELVAMDRMVMAVEIVVMMVVEMRMMMENVSPWLRVVVQWEHNQTIDL